MLDRNIHTSSFYVNKELGSSDFVADATPGSDLKKTLQASRIRINMESRLCAHMFGLKIV